MHSKSIGKHIPRHKVRCDYTVHCVGRALCCCLGSDIVDWLKLNCDTLVTHLH